MQRVEVYKTEGMHGDSRKTKLESLLAGLRALMGSIGSHCKAIAFFRGVLQDVLCKTLCYIRFLAMRQSMRPHLKSIRMECLGT